MTIEPEDVKPQEPIPHNYSMGRLNVIFALVVPRPAGVDGV